VVLSIQTIDATTIPNDGLSSPPRWGRFFVQFALELRASAMIYFAEAETDHGSLAKAKSNGGTFNAQLAGWAIAFSALAGILLDDRFHETCVLEPMG
jgi:hypothetical protein